MKQELAAVFALMKLLVTKLHVQKTELFIEKLLVALKEKFQDHWYPDNPSKGQAYRCIRVNLSNSQDPELMRACKESGVQFCELGLPPVLTLWVDPGEVACRIGEDNPCFSVARFPNNSKSGVEDSSSSGSDSDSSSGMHLLFDFPPGMLRPCYQEKVISSLGLTKASEALQKRPGSFLFSFVHILYIKTCQECKSASSY
ncbi:protein BTG3 isoform X1 [Hippocampus zosterae]|uniref:protein BTG3 isoform X1 n=1 Tax=Hippocampus zosterae TaxID=109293 RepID=UPI00223CFC2C|nr:protein BTG3 isoform X1 [Hippocampus zosterae]